MIEEVSNSDLDFQLRQGDKILNNSQFFHITGLSKLQALGDCYDGDTMVNQPGDLRRGSTVSILSQAGGRRSSVISLVSNSGENVVKMTVRTNRTRRLSSVATQLATVNIPIVIVTAYRGEDLLTLAQRVSPVWDKGYRNFKFRWIFFFNFILMYFELRLKKTIREREEYLERRIKSEGLRNKSIQSKN